MSLYTSVTGLNAANTSLATIANNIANVGSTGFKKSTATFNDLFASSQGTDATKTIGIGALFKGVNQKFTQGPIQSTGNTLDLALAGSGFFVTRSATGETALTRDGAFSVGTDRSIVTATGSRLMGYPVGTDGAPSALGTGALQPITVPATSGAPHATTTLSLDVNLPSSATVPTAPFSPIDPASYSSSTSSTIYDALGNPLTATVYYVRTSTPTGTTPTSGWDAHLVIGGSEASTGAGAPTPAKLVFDAQGNLTSPTTGIAFQPFTPASGGAALSLTLDQNAATTQVAQPFGLVSTAQDGSTAGRLSNLAIDTGGLVSATYSNGQIQALGRIAIGNVDSEQGLKQIGDASWLATGRSGPLLAGQAGQDGLGSVQSGSLEVSNVDLSNELVDLIAAQRDFQANAKAVETDGNMTQSILAIHS